MQRYILKALVGLFFVIATCQVASGHSLSFIRALTEEAQAEEQAAAVDSNVDHANTLEDRRADDFAKDGKKKRFRQKFVNVELVGADHTINEGDSFELACNVDASPEPKVYWFRGNIPTQQINELFKTSVPSVTSDPNEVSLWQVQSKYVVDCASQQDQGQIHCVAISGEKTTWQSSVINVRENSNGTRACKTSRAPVITYHAPTVLTFMETSVVLPCRAVGSPRPQTRWVKSDGTEITRRHNDSRYKVLADGSLLIENIEWSDMGVPTCIAESSSGVSRAETFLYPLKREL